MSVVIAAAVRSLLLSSRTSPCFLASFVAGSGWRHVASSVVTVVPSSFTPDPVVKTLSVVVVARTTVSVVLVASPIVPVTVLVVVVPLSPVPAKVALIFSSSCEMSACAASVVSLLPRSLSPCPKSFLYVGSSLPLRTRGAVATTAWWRVIITGT